MQAYSKGLIEIGDGDFAYLQPDGGWGWSNAGLIVGDGESMLVDTLFDLKLTAEMLAEMSAITTTVPIATLVNTHANGDHCYGNELVSDVEIIATDKAAQEMEEVPAAMLAAMMNADFGPVLNAYLRECFGPFEFGGITLTPPTKTFSNQIDIEVGGRTVELIEVGPAHTAGDLVVHLPDTKTVYAGDVLFITGTPIVWAGPYSNWTNACDRLLAMDLDHIVPGHGPMTDKAGIETVQRYLNYVYDEASIRFAGGMSAIDASFDIDLGEFADLGDAERIAINVDSVYRELDPNHPRVDVIELFSRMAKLAAR